MTAPRTRRETKAYDKHLKYVEPPEIGCAFCQIDANSHQLIKQTNAFKVVRNIFPYSLWDSQPVQDHLLLLPSIHTDTLADITAEDAKEYVSIISYYESRGYSVYARAPSSIMKSLVHQHTHLIKTSPRKIKGLIYLRKPYVRLVVK